MLLAVAMLAIGITALVYNLATPGRNDIAKDKITAAALEQAKAALIGYAVSVDLSTGRPGDLPCPDSNDSGTPNAPCDTQASRIGRLPWKTLGLPDLRDGDGERLWYAVSTNFKSSTRTSCASPGNAGCLNSDARGTITVRNGAGTVVYDGSNPSVYTPSGAIAVIFAPGGVLQRQDTGTTQDRSCTGGSCTAAGVCNSAPVTNTPKCNSINYLDISGTNDNALFTDGSSTLGLINGPIRDASNNVVMNDRLIVISYNDLMPALERRVAKEVMSCLTSYASVAQNRGRYPWAAPIITWPLFADDYDTRFGRVPDAPLIRTQLGLSGGVAGGSCPSGSSCMSPNWPTSCGITLGTWWNNWKELVFYGVADSYKPADPISGSLVPFPGGCGSCLTVDPPSPSGDKKVVVMVAGKQLSGVSGGQPRSSDRTLPANYLEDANADPSYPYTSQNIYIQQSNTSTFNDVLLYQ